MFTGDNEYTSLFAPGECQEQMGYVIGKVGKGQHVRPQMPGQKHLDTAGLWTSNAGCKTVCITVLHPAENVDMLFFFSFILLTIILYLMYNVHSI